MEQTLPFGDVLDAIDQLSLEEQETLVDIVQRRVTERSRKLLASEIREAQEEFTEGRCQAVTVEELMKEVLA
ncbi:MAG: hypothetical protein EXR78_08645 [Deltaproteobacteria bacterium]|nr:hypothetical protein [Deltaproteobacteria bacterium]